MHEIQDCDGLRRWIASASEGDKAEYCIGSISHLRTTLPEADRICETIIAAYELGCLTTVLQRRSTFPQPSIYIAIRTGNVAPKWLVNGSMPIRALRVLINAHKRPSNEGLKRFLRSHMDLSASALNREVRWLVNRGFVEKGLGDSYLITEKGTKAVKV